MSTRSVVASYLLFLLVSPVIIARTSSAPSVTIHSKTFPICPLPLASATIICRYSIKGGYAQPLPLQSLRSFGVALFGVQEGQSLLVKTPHSSGPSLPNLGTKSTARPRTPPTSISDFIVMGYRRCGISNGWKERLLNLGN
jgi:hypothetical protein